MIGWGNGEPCPICGKEFDKPDMEHLLSHPEAMNKLFPENDVRDKRKERDEAMDSYLKRIAEIYGVKNYQHRAEMWTKDDDENPIPGKTVIQVTISF